MRNGTAADFRTCSDLGLAVAGFDGERLRAGFSFEQALIFFDIYVVEDNAQSVQLLALLQNDDRFPPSIARYLMTS